MSAWSSAAIIFTALGALVFVCAYAWTTRGAWRDTVVGLNVMAFMSAILIVSALAVAAIIWGTNWPYRDAIRFSAWSLIGAIIWWRVIILFKVQRRD
jgi:hypothetical protein